jgi:hypothetical protein
MAPYQGEAPVPFKLTVSLKSKDIPAPTFVLVDSAFLSPVRLIARNLDPPWVTPQSCWLIPTYLRFGVFIS